MHLTFKHHRELRKERAEREGVFSGLYTYVLLYRLVLPSVTTVRFYYDTDCTKLSA